MLHSRSERHARSGTVRNVEHLTIRRRRHTVNLGGSGGVVQRENARPEV